MTLHSMPEGTLSLLFILCLFLLMLSIRIVVEMVDRRLKSLAFLGSLLLFLPAFSQRRF